MSLTIHRLDPSIPVYIPDRDVSGEALAWFDYGKEEHVLWMVALDTTGEVWLLPNTQIRLMNNPSIGRVIE